MKLFFIYAVIALSAIGCGRNYKPDQPADTKNQEQILDASRSLVHEEAKAIEDFVSRHGWKMQMTGSGLHYDIYQEGHGPKADNNKVLTIAYESYLLDGTLCYKADEQHPLQLITGRGQQINGLEEGLMMMREGSRARFVIPNHLAYGITGDQEKIPPASALFYDVYVMKVDSATVK